MRNTTTIATADISARLRGTLIKRGHAPDMPIADVVLTPELRSALGSVASAELEGLQAALPPVPETPERVLRAALQTLCDAAREALESVELPEARSRLQQALIDAQAALMACRLLDGRLAQRATRGRPLKPQVEQARSLLRAGRSIADVITATGLSESTVRRHLAAIRAGV